MLYNYFKITVRNLWRNKMLSFVNIAGLAVGLACVMLIMIFIHDEFSYDTFHKKSARISRLVQTETDTAGKQRKMGNTGNPQGPVFKSYIPEIETYCRLKGWELTTKKDNEGLPAKTLFVDTSFFSIFSFTTLSGNAVRPFTNNNSIVITDEAATRYFGKKDPIGKTITIEVDSFELFTVTAVVKKAPINSSIQFDILMPFEKQMPVDPKEYDESMNDWGSSYQNTFFLLRPGADRKVTEQKIAQVYAQVNSKGIEEAKSSRGIVSKVFTLQPFLKMHLDEDFYASNGLENWSDPKDAYILGGFAVLVLIIAAINFINISLARSLKRSKEIGIRKTVGGSRKQLIRQFLGEAFVITLVSFLPALFIVRICLPTFAEMAQRHYSFGYLLQPQMLALFTGLLIVVAFLAGSYPALVVSRFQPMQVLTGRFKLSRKNRLGQSLVTMQFAIAIMLIISTIIFGRQFHYMTKGDLGYDISNTLRLYFPSGNTAAYRSFKNELAANPLITSVTSKGGDFNKTMFEVNGKKTDWTYYETVDDNYLQQLKIPLVTGRYLSYSYPADTISNCIVNESFVKQLLNKNENPIGQQVTRGKNKYSIVGIVKDYHLVDYTEMIEPVFVSLDTRQRSGNIHIKYSQGQGKQTEAVVRKIYKALMPFTTLEMTYMDDWIMERYSKDDLWRKVANFSALIIILISCMGLFALASLSVEQRTKEIGIRKVLGASVSNVIFLVTSDFLKLVLISFIIAVPVAWWVMSKWLEDFAYRISIGWWIFAIAGSLAAVIAFITISFQAIRAAVANPVKSLRTE